MQQKKDITERITHGTLPVVPYCYADLKQMAIKFRRDQGFHFTRLQVMDAMTVQVSGGEANNFVLNIGNFQT